MIRRLLLFALLTFLTSCGATKPSLPGKIAFTANTFPFTGEYGSNYGVCVYEDGKVQQFYRGGDAPKWIRNGQSLLIRRTAREWLELEYPSRKILRTIQFPRIAWWLVVLPSQQQLIYAGWDEWKEGEKRVHTPKNLFLYDLATGKEEQLTHFTDVRPTILIDGVDISPDGKTIVFSMDTPDPEITDPKDYNGGLRKFVFKLDLTSGELTRLFKGGNPRFMPDGYRIACDIWELGGVHRKTTDLFYYDLATGQFSQLTHNGENDLERSPAVSPDGQQIAFIVEVFGAGTGGRSLRVINADGTNERVLVGNDGHDYQDPDWGP